MRIFTFVLCAAITILGATEAKAGNEYALDTYPCAEFLTDVGNPNDSTKLIKSMMMIAWATGYAAAHHKSKLQADTRAIQLIAATLGDTCRKRRESAVVKAFADVVEETLN